MADDPASAYAEAKAAREKRLNKEQQANEAANSLPERAATRLKELIAPIESMMPAGLSVNVKITPAGSLGKHGVKGLLLDLIEGTTVIGHGVINCDDSEIIHFESFPPHDPKNPNNTSRKQEDRNIQLALLDEARVKKFVTALITEFVK